MVLVAVPFLSEQTGLSGIDVILGEKTKIADLPWDLHLAAEREERYLFGEARQPAAVLIDVAKAVPEAIHPELIRALATLQLHGSGSTTCREAWFFDETEERVAVIPVAIRAFDPGQDFALRAGVNEDQLEAAHSILSAALKQEPALEVTLEHLLLAVGRGDLSRGLIDGTICLESLIKSQEEVSFRFSHQIGRVVSQGPTTLAEAQDLLRDLYRYRSDHVHGNRSRRHSQRQSHLWDEWAELEHFMKVCVTYALDFYASDDGKPKGAWEGHLDALMTGNAVRRDVSWGTLL